MDYFHCCRTCLNEQNLNLIFPLPGTVHSEKYAEVIYTTTGIKVSTDDNLPQLICTPCIDLINQCYKFRKKCQESEKTLLKWLSQKPNYDIKLEQVLNTEASTSIDISDLIDDNEFGDFDDNITLNKYHLEAETSNPQETVKVETKTQEIIENIPDATPDVPSQNNIQIANNVVKKKSVKTKDKAVKTRGRTKKENQEEKRTKEKKERVKEEIECELCHKVLTSRLSLRNHNKLHTGFDIICEHCGKKFLTRRLLLMHCKAKHGYQKTDKCSYCEYTASNAEQVKIHERLHTGEKPFSCSQCDARFHRKSSYLQHVAIHLPDKTVQCDQCPARFKSVTLMRIHRARHGAPRYSYSCGVCGNSFARRRNVARHLQRLHALQPDAHLIARTNSHHA